MITRPRTARSLTAIGLSLLFVACTGDPSATEPESLAADVQATDICDGNQVALTECEAMVALYNNTDGPEWSFPSSGWGTATNPCTWAGVLCLNAPLGPVHALFLDQRNLTGPLPSELANLTALEALVLDINNLTGPIPPEFGGLAHLTRLSLSENDLTGLIPIVLANAHSLRQLNLNSNQLTGTIPSSLGQLPALEAIGLAGNQLTGPVPASFGMTPALTLLRLEDNQLSGAIPPELGSADALYVLDLSSNELSGLVPLSVALLGGRIQALDPASTPGVPRCDLSGNPSLYLPDVETYRDADLDHDGLVCGVGFTPVSQVGDDAVDGINDLPLNAGLANALASKIENATAKADEGHYQAAINQMQAFISQLETLVGNGTLTASQAGPFFEQANELITIWAGLL